HDYEAHEKIKQAYIENNIPLLENDELLIEIPRLTKILNKPFQVQIVGSLFYFDRKIAKEKTEKLFKNFPRKSNEIPRIFLIHNPAMISYVPLDDSCEIIFSGHYHGGQIRIGPKKRMTLVKTMYKIMKLIKKERYEKVYPPDQGLYGRGKLRVYSHRGTGHYGFPFLAGKPNNTPANDPSLIQRINSNNFGWRAKAHKVFAGKTLGDLKKIFSMDSSVMDRFKDVLDKIHSQKKEKEVDSSKVSNNNGQLETKNKSNGKTARKTKGKKNSAPVSNKKVRGQKAASKTMKISVSTSPKKRTSKPTKKSTSNKRIPRMRSSGGASTLAKK
ncbi:predicted protein, partial [Naegleria gruberi]